MTINDNSNRQTCWRFHRLTAQCSFYTTHIWNINVLGWIITAELLRLIICSFMHYSIDLYFVPRPTVTVHNICRQLALIRGKCQARLGGSLLSIFSRVYSKTLLIHTGNLPQHSRTKCLTIDRRVQTLHSLPTLSWRTTFSTFMCTQVSLKQQLMNEEWRQSQKGNVYCRPD